MKDLFHENQGRISKWHNCFLALACLSLTYSCGSVISQSTVNLSANVGSRISEMEYLHQLAVQRYFDLEQQKVEDFLTETWEPLFLRNFLGTSQVLAQLQNLSVIDATIQNQLENAFTSYLTDPSESSRATDELVVKLNDSRKNEAEAVRVIVSDYVEDDRIEDAVIHITSLLGTDEPARIIFEFAEAAHLEMNARRQSLLAPLEQVRNETVSEISAAYAELIRGQSTITGRLEASAKVSQQQDQLLGALGINKTTQNIQSKLSNVTSKIDGALSLAGSITAKDGDKGINVSDNILKSLTTQLQGISTSSKVK